MPESNGPFHLFDASLNLYRGCEHGCIYCFARPTHEYLGFSAGLDFESRILEPRAAVPRQRLETVEALASAGIPVGVMIAPVIPGLTEHEIPGIVEAAARAGARWVTHIPLRLPHGVANLFEDWLEEHFPERKKKIMNRILAIRGGQLNDPRFHSRMRGIGFYAEQIRNLVTHSTRRAGLEGRQPSLAPSAFRRPADPQLSLFDSRA